MKRVVLVCILVSFPTIIASADGDVIKERKAILKKYGEATKPLASMLKKVQPFDLQAVRLALETYSSGSRKLPDLFPDTSKTGGETEALPAIWDEKTKFIDLFKKLDLDSTSAQKMITDEATFRSEMPKVIGDCKQCHDHYREKK